MTPHEHQREHYRIEYPTAARPRFLGTVVRLIDRDVALRLRVGVPLRVVLEEQRYIREGHRGSGW